MRVLRPSVMTSRLALTLALVQALLQAGLGLWTPALAQSPAELEAYQRRLEQLFERLDRNGDRRLTPDEVEGHPYLERHFQRLDRQGRGHLVPSDLTPTNPAARGERARKFFSRADRNGDGRLDRNEAEPYPWLQRRFNDADANGDGVVTRDELRQLRRRQAGGS
jgi:hypothetical protein